MSDDARIPGAPGDDGPDPWSPPERGPAAGPAGPAGPGDTVPRPGVPLDKPPAGPSPWAAPADAAPAGAAPPSVHDQHTVTSLPGAVLPPGGATAPANPFAPPDASGGRAAPYGTAYGAPVHPFAPPAGPHPGAGSALPPPPVAPDGPGGMPYGYGYPAAAGYGGGGPGHGVPGGQGYGWPGMHPVMPPMPSNGLGTAALVLGIIAAVGFCLWPVALVCGVLAVIFGAIGRGKARRGEATNPGQALAGIICGVVGIALGVAFAVVFFFLAGEESVDSPDGSEGGYSAALTPR
ncbi:DUF4190 domain-containing protein [Streptomyces fructofermentans]|uniref:DUF4190 domain-containing protein n=1 Tax=Streptomyces fructofermentans TaxID=152141 RepID=A0A918U3P9_9ACTN|nr:DUF4190 domain-containing protein [Streptomyces fructofermentans]GGX88601.1 hypothetical protein GCM10010515_64850 [Streptomyces fructofermentans]